MPSAAQSESLSSGVAVPPVLINITLDTPCVRVVEHP
jgi:hypothetical protein